MHNLVCDDTCHWYIPSWLVDKGLQLGLHLIIGQEGLVARVSDSQGIPVLEQGGPGLEQSTHTQRA